MKVNRIIETTAQIASAMSGITRYSTDVGTPEDNKLRDNIIAELGFKQEEGYYAARRYLTAVADVKGGISLVELVYHEPVDLLPGSASTVPVYLSKSVKDLMGSSEKDHLRVAKEIVKAMRDTKYPHFIVGRKGKLFFSAMPFAEHPWVKHFAKHGKLYRNELLAVAFAARGIALSKGKRIATPEIIVSAVADGVEMVLSKSQGEALGLYPGMWQFRQTFPFAKGLIVVWADDNVLPFFNKDILKLNEDIPAEINGDNMLYIANSDEAYDIRISHQLGYVLKNTIKSKNGAWGDMPSLIKNAIVKEVKDKAGEDQVNGYQIPRVAVEELMPDYIRFLQSAGLPKKHIMTVQQIMAKAEEKKDDFKAKVAGRDLIDTVLLAARPNMGKMFMFAALPASRFPGMKPGWYHPATNSKGHSKLTDHIGRVPFMAVGGGIQKIKWVGESPLLNTIICIVDDTDPNWEDSENWKIISAMGADSDGDRLIILTAQGLKMMKSAGLTIETEPESFKAKNPYPGLDKWTPEQLLEFWARSTPRLANVGKGDVITRDAIDMYKADEMDWKFYWRFARYGAGEVQVGVSAPKYYFLNPNRALAPMTGKQLTEEMKERGVGQGRKFFGLLWDEARERAEEYVAEYLPEIPEDIVLPKTLNENEWQGGYSEFHTAMKAFSPELGVDWPTYVRRAFVKQLNKEGIDNDQIRKGLKGNTARYVHKMIVAYVRRYPHRMNIWCWLLDEKFTGVPKDVVLKVVGLPFEQKED